MCLTAAVNFCSEMGRGINSLTPMCIASMRRLVSTTWLITKKLTDGCWRGRLPSLRRASAALGSRLTTTSWGRILAAEQGCECINAIRLGDDVDAELPEEISHFLPVGRVGIDDGAVQLNVHMMVLGPGVCVVSSENAAVERATPGNPRRCFTATEFRTVSISEASPPYSRLRRP